MVFKVSQLFRCFLCVFVVFFVSCKKEGEAQDSKSSNTEQIKRNNSGYLEIEKEKRIFKVEGVDSEGNVYKGSVSLIGDVGAGKICSENKEHIYIDVKRSLEGGVEGVDNNGNVYRLLFTNYDE